MSAAPPSADDGRWGPRTSGTAGRRALSRDGIVAAALRIADADGLDAVSMPRLARELGAAPMSLYRHIANKDALVDLVLDDAIGDPPDLSGHGVREGLEVWARANHDVFLRHPWTLPLVSSPRRMGPREAAWAEAVLALLVDAGCPLPVAADVLLTVNSYVRGVSIPVDNRLPLVADISRSGRDAELPHLLELLAGDPDGTGGSSSPFERGLERVLAGVVGDLPEDSSL